MAIRWVVVKAEDVIIERNYGCEGMTGNVISVVAH